MRRKSAAMTLSVILLILAGCGDQETGPGDSGGPLNGSWQFERHLSMMDFACHTTGTVTLKQVGDDFTGEVKNSREDCSGDFSPSGSDDDDGPLMNGVIAKATVTFFQPNGVCTYLGTAPDAPIDAMDGEVTCTQGDAAPHYWWSGSWSLKS